VNDKSEKTKRLIEQLLRKAESTTPEEAEALTEHAERLMLKYGIEEAMLNVSGEVTEVIVRKDMFVSGIYAMELFEQTAVWSQEMSVKCFFVDYRGYGMFRDGKTVKGVKILFVGFESDVERVMGLAASLHLQSIRAMREWNKTRYRGPWESGMDAYIARRSFVSHFGVGVADRIRKNKLQVVEEHGPGTELVLVERVKKVSDWVDNNMKLRTVDSQKRASYEGMNAGFRAGQQATGTEHSLTSGRAIER